jgi:hypothetical protein
VRTGVMALFRGVWRIERGLGRPRRGMKRAYRLKGAGRPAERRGNRYLGKGGKIAALIASNAVADGSADPPDYCRAGSIVLPHLYRL